MTEKRYILSHNGKEVGILDKTNDKGYYGFELARLVNELSEENKKLKKELTKFKEWEKYVGDVKREELDGVFKMSVYEIAEGFEYYQKRIKELEKDVDYWKQVASQYSNELNVFEHCKKYKTKCKDIYWSSDVE